VLRKFEQERLSRLGCYSNLGPLARLTFDNLSPQGRSNNPEQQKWFRHCYDVAKAFALEPKGWLILTGPSGCGKTHLAAAIANECIARGCPVFFEDVAELLDHLRATFSPNSDVSYDALFEQVRNAPLLILDGLGSQSSTPWAEEKMFQILNYRFNARLPLVVTAISLNQLDERLYTRLKDQSLAQELELEKSKPQLFRQIGGLSEEKLTTMTFANFDLRQTDRELRESLGRAWEAAQQFANSAEDWLIFVGPHGCGKTHLAAAIANEQLTLGRPVFFAVVPDLLDYLRSNLSPEVKRGFEEFEQLKTHPLLILDDLGTEAETPWAREKLYQIINYRYNSRLPMVITATRFSLEKLEPGLLSRISDNKISAILPMGGPPTAIRDLEKLFRRALRER
jgi:DNA replication protein DnaC